MCGRGEQRGKVGRARIRARDDELARDERERERESREKVTHCGSGRAVDLEQESEREQEGPEVSSALSASLVDPHQTAKGKEIVDK